MTPAIFDLLRNTTRERFDGSVTRLAEACDVSVQLASKWLAENERKRVTPGPASCEKIAAALGLDPDYVLELAGHRSPREQSQQPDPLETYIRARMPEMREALQDVPRPYWGTVIKATFDRAIDGARDMAHLVNELASVARPVRNTAEDRVSKLREPANSDDEGDGPVLAQL